MNDNNEPGPKGPLQIPSREELLLALKSFSGKEHKVFIGLGIFFTISFIGFLYALNTLVTVEVPAHGGALSEGIVGTPRFINPILALSDADRDLTSLVYAGLMKKTSSGEIIPEIAESYEISPDGLSYTFRLRSNAIFHDGTPITADDVLYTVSHVKDPLVKSSRRASWEGVTVQKIDEHTVSFALKQKYFPFLENTTLGILPAHIWRNLTPEQMGFSDLNTEPTGAGPYEIVKVQKNSSGIPDYYELRAFSRYVLGKPYITSFTIRFYPNELQLLNAFDNGLVDQISAVSTEAAQALKESGYRVERTTLPRVFGIFFNQNQNELFADKNIRLALSLAIDRESIIESILRGYGTPTDNPLPGIINSDEKDYGAKLEEAREILRKAGFATTTDGTLVRKMKNGNTRLAFSISTGDVPELAETAKRLKENFEALGASVELKIFETGDLNQNIIRPRKYDALFFGEIVGFDSDPFPFWHSSQRNDPGLNIAMYTNARVDKILEGLRATLDSEKRKEAYIAFEAEVEKDLPAIFVYSPDFIYAVSQKLDGLALGNVTIPSDRFLSIKNWHLESDRVWKPLVKFTDQ